jgi:RNA polymerase sigma-70 factor (ECF subfamily)
LHKPQDSISELIERVRDGSESAAGTLFENCRGYLLAIANNHLDDLLRPKFGGSDLVQQTLLHAHRDFAAFRGRSEGELLAWLQAILLNEIARARRDYLGTAKRDISREVPFGQDDGSRSGLAGLVADTRTPGRQVSAREDHARLRAALARLSESHRTVLELRNRDLLTFAEIGQRMALGEEAARRLWARAVESLRHELVRGNDADPP